MIVRDHVLLSPVLSMFYIYTGVSMSTEGWGSLGASFPLFSSSYLACLGKPVYFTIFSFISVQVFDREIPILDLKTCFAGARSPLFLPFLLTC